MSDRPGRCPTHGEHPRRYEVYGQAYCAELAPDAIDTGDTCDERLITPCAEGCTCETCRYARAVARGGEKL